MKKIKNVNIYTGNMYDYEDVRGCNGWSALHCCKDPYHKELVGYNNKLPSNHPNYAYCIEGKRMALNLVDTDFFDNSYLSFNYDMFMTAFEFVDAQLGDNKKVIIHCNEGISRSPMIIILYLKYAKIDGYNELDFNEAIEKFIIENDVFIKPKRNIYNTSKNIWNMI